MNSGKQAPFRNKTVGFRVTSDDFELLQSRANVEAKTLSEWSRDVLLRAARQPEGNPFEQAIVGEMMALRTILTQFNYYYVSKSSLTFEQVKAIWKQAEETKHKKALELLRQVSAERNIPPPQKGWSK